MKKQLFIKQRIKKSIKRAFYFTIYYSGVLRLFVLICKRIRENHCAVILFYHRLSLDPMDNLKLPHLDIRAFRKQMHHIRKWYDVISMDELAGELARGKGFCSPSIVVTIDDGYLNNYTFAFPILRQLELPATIYLTTGCIGTKKGLWVDDLEDMLFFTNAKSICFSELVESRNLDISNCRGKGEALLKLFGILVGLEHSRKILCMQELSRATRIEEIYDDKDDRKMLNWKEVAEMSSVGISFGAHTVNHPTLSKMEHGEAEWEIYESKMEIETKLGNRVKHFAVPNGKIGDFNEELKEYCKKIGLETVVSTEPGTVYAESDRYFLKRINPSPPIHIFACELARYLFMGIC